MANVSIPEAEPGDSEALVSALHNAALFARLGDDDETLHWLQRAAESAGTSGDDRRMLTLARIASDFSQALRASNRALPSPAKAPPQARASRPPPPSARAGPPNGRPASPAKLPPLNANRSRPLVPRELGATPRLPEVSERASPTPNAKSSAASAPVSSVLRPPAKPITKLTPAAPAPISTPVDDAPTKRAATHLRQAARVSVVASPTEPGTFSVRLLPDGAPAPAGAFEALLIASHASDAPFSLTPEPPSSEPLTPPLRKAPAAR